MYQIWSEYFGCFQSAPTPMITFVVLCWTSFSTHASLLYQGAQLSPAPHMGLTSAERRVGITSRGWLATLPHAALGAFSTPGLHGWLMVNTESARMARSLSAQLPSSWPVPEPEGLFLPWCRACRWPLLDFMRFL